MCHTTTHPSSHTLLVHVDVTSTTKGKNLKIEQDIYAINMYVTIDALQINA